MPPPTQLTGPLSLPGINDLRTNEQTRPPITPTNSKCPANDDHYLRERERTMLTQERRKEPSETQNK